MRYLILSDLHANWHALEAVVRAAEGLYDQAVCCGDLVGYGAEPNRVTEWVGANCSLVVRGNHDRSCTGLDNSVEWFNPVAKQAVLWTLGALTPENADYVRALPKGPLTVASFELVHGAPYDEDDYLFASAEATQAFGYLEHRVVFFGHTHTQGGFIWNHSRVETILRPSPRSDWLHLPIDPECAYLINPGSVGQPRDGDPRAAFALYDDEAQRVSFGRVVYDVEGARKQIYDAALPPILGDRLLVGR